MFERYTEKARRVIFFARYEASQFGSPFIDTEHLLLGLLREDKALANRFLGSPSAVEAIRKQIEGHTPPGQKVSTSVDLRLSHSCKRVLSYGAEEAKRLDHKHIGTEHLLLGLLREQNVYSAQLLGNQGLTLDSVRNQVQPVQPSPSSPFQRTFASLAQWLAECEARGGIRTKRQRRVAKRTTQVAIYAVDQPAEDGKSRDASPAERLAQIQDQIDSVAEKMENAIANHEFEQARFYSDEERKERENLRLLREQFNLEEPAPRVPFLCIDIIREDSFTAVQECCDDYIAVGVAQVWLLSPDLKRAYTATKEEGLRECISGVLQTANPPLELDLNTIFD
jgi:ATP-dependent Clp protease ATP-binding subunit ClpA